LPYLPSLLLSSSIPPSPFPSPIFIVCSQSNFFPLHADAFSLFDLSSFHFFFFFRSSKYKRASQTDSIRLCPRKPYLLLSPFVLRYKLHFFKGSDRTLIWSPISILMPVSFTPPFPLSWPSNLPQCDLPSTSYLFCLRQDPRLLGMAEQIRYFEFFSSSHFLFSDCFYQAVSNLLGIRSESSIYSPIPTPPLPSRINTFNLSVRPSLLCLFPLQTI